MLDASFISPDLIQTLFHSLATNLYVEPKEMFTNKLLFLSLNATMVVPIFPKTAFVDHIWSADSG
ncbi:MAG: hypothetical protein LBF15_00695 [Candidatus Peribacteria bacterium]|nr:hypothetical protein [Candidatus Peribacteria bacterium]